jgi:hypothetical protein
MLTRDNRILQICFDNRVWITGEEAYLFGRDIVLECIEVVKKLERTPKEFIQPKNSRTIEEALLEHFQCRDEIKKRSR